MRLTKFPDEKNQPPRPNGLSHGVVVLNVIYSSIGCYGVATTGSRITGPVDE